MMASASCLNATDSRSDIARVRCVGPGHALVARGGDSCVWEQPQAISIVAGGAEGLTELTAFDRALMDAGIANLNFVRVTSILPTGVAVIPIPRFVPGTLVPAVYARIVSHTPGERIAAAVGLGFSRSHYGVIMEYEHTGTAENAEAIVRKMVEEAMAVRDLPLHEIRVAVKEHVVQRIGCAIAAVVFWPEARGLVSPPRAAGR